MLGENIKLPQQDTEAMQRYVTKDLEPIKMHFAAAASPRWLWNVPCISII